jgi:hypothetical protein
MMTKLEREKYLLALNDAQRLALLFTLSNQLYCTGNVSYKEFEGMITAYRTKEERKERG